MGVHREERAWIVLSDGCRLAARLWLPADAGPAAPVSAVLEYLPYRLGDRTAWQDSTRHPYFAARGFAAVRVDIRGTGDSDGILCDEYLSSEQDDALEVLEWIAAQPWCSGSVGMIGYSWGGFNGLQVAARRPPALKAVVSAYSTDDRYTDDCHYLGGAVLANDMLRWAQTMRAINALPPDPAVVGARWREMWEDRLTRTPHFAEAWLTHQRRDAYWRQGSVAEDYSAIQAATLLVGGWADGYTNAVPRLLEHLRCPRAGIIGPWGHVFPERGVPGPAIGFLGECVSWFDRWLNGVENGADRWPLLQAWIQEPAEPAAYYAERPGRWVAFREWPPRSAAPGAAPPRSAAPAVVAAPTVAAAHGSRLRFRPPSEAAEPAVVSTPQTLGAAAGVWCGNGLADELPTDQREDDERSLVFETDPLEARLEFLGSPEIRLEIACDQPVAHLVVRLCAVAANGTSTLLSCGVLNLTHRRGHECPEPLVPGEQFEVRVGLNVLGQAVAAGDRLRIAISSTWWPMLWPPAAAATLTVWPSTLEVSLPLLSAEQVAPREFGPPEHAKPIGTVGGGPRGRTREVRAQGADVVIAERELSEQLQVASSTCIREENSGEWRISDGDPGSAWMRFERDYSIERGQWRPRVLAAAEMTATPAAYRVSERLEVFEGDKPVHGIERTFEVPRDLT